MQILNIRADTGIFNISVAKRAVSDDENGVAEDRHKYGRIKLLSKLDLTGKPEESMTMHQNSHSIPRPRSDAV